MYGAEHAPVLSMRAQRTAQSSQDVVRLYHVRRAEYAPVLSISKSSRGRF